MKKSRQFCAALSLSFLLSLSAVGGEIGTPGIAAEPSTTSSTAAGDVGSPSIAATGDVSTAGATALDPLSELTLRLLRSVLSLF